MLKDITDIFQRDPLHFFGHSLVTVTDVKVAVDLSLAKVYFSILPIEKASDVLFNLNEKKAEIRRKLGNQIGKRVRKIPELAFFHDDTEEKASYLDRLIDNLDIPPEEGHEVEE